MSEFTNLDKKIVVALLRKLPLKQRVALTLRFWHNFEILEVANKINVSWDEADQLIESGLEKLKSFCLEQPLFSKAELTHAA